ncbi:protein AMBP isoform X2 [Limanda limanda]|uniref:protein AMBP isoform X2 n=1 Tax=Limanda limanda TaxID=27771 RepID=UPI0029C6EFEA|nr:protein AMBP isoform X2 [Limanda limanda]
MMKTTVVLVPLLLLGWTCSLQGLPVLPEPLYPTQENFDLNRFVGTWHDVAVTSSCPHMQSHRADAAIGKLVLEKDIGNKLKVTKSKLRHGTCVEMSGEYELTSTPGRIFYHIDRWDADVDAYVVHTNYDEYAIIIMSKLKASGENSTSLKLYSRTMSVRDTVLDDFKTLVRQQGMSDDTVIIKQDKGDCVPGEQVNEPPSQPEKKRLRRQVVPSLAPAEEEGSGDMSPLFNDSEACKAAPESGPCFGFFRRYFYNSTSMRCELFTYGGCLGNQNNFETMRECLQRCRTEAVCRLPMDPEPCTGQPTIWAFDSVTGTCMPYKDGICQANANQFYSRAECQEYCGVVKDDGELLTAS